MDGGAWGATVYGVTNSWTRLSDFTYVDLCTAQRYYEKNICPISLQPWYGHPFISNIYRVPRTSPSSCPLEAYIIKEDKKQQTKSYVNSQRIKRIMGKSKASDRDEVWRLLFL